jgi:hypothetical protein
VLSRVFLTIGAWLVGATAATCGSLIAVSLIGQSIGGPATEQLTTSGVNRALAAADDHGASPSPTDSPADPATATPPSVKATPSASPAAGSPAPASPAAASPAAAASTGTLLSSAGGSVVATCGPAGVYLLSWSPQSGYATDDVVRGPAVTAQVQFETASREVSMVVSCAGSVPSASVTIEANGGGGGGPGDT